MIITIDGPSGTGKTTVAKELAKQLGIDYFDTGAMYRTVAYGILKLGIDILDEKALCHYLDQFDLQIVDEPGHRRYLAFGEDVTAKIRLEEVSQKASMISQLLPVRATLVKLQRAYAEGRDVVFEGRDMGTVVFPKAEFKFFLTARPQVRAGRRHLQFPKELTEQQILEAMEKRDLADQTRAISPLKQAEDAHLIDTSDLSVDQVVEALLRIVRCSG